ncbi:hypothetical protein D9M73_115270 [compost metagenome]
MATVLGQAFEVARHIIAAHHIEHRRAALAPSDLGDTLDEVLGLVIDRMRRAERDRRRAFVVRASGDDHLQPEDRAQGDRHRADTAGAAMDQHGIALGRICALKQIGPHGEQCLRQGRRLNHRQRVGHRQHLPRRDRDIFGIAAACQQSTHRLTGHVDRNIRPLRDDRARHFQPRDRGSARRWRVTALALQHIRPIHTRRDDADQHFIGPRHRHRALHHAQHLGPARHVRVDRSHRCRNAVHRSCALFCFARLIDMARRRVNDPAYGPRRDSPETRGRSARRADRTGP